MNLIRRAILAFALIAGITPAFAQAPPPVPGLPDSERRTSYSISATTCICNVNFALYGDSTDYQNWIEVYLNGALVNFNDATFGWTITSPTGPLASIPRPVTDAVLTFTNAQTGTVQIVGARRPRRVSQFSENRGVPARDLNQVLTDIIAQNREIWDKTNDFTGRALVSQPGVDLGLLPLPSACQGKFLGFDVTGLIPQCNSAGPGSGNVTGIGSSTAGNVPVYADATGANIQDSGIKPTSPKTCTTSNWFNTLAGGVLGCSQPSFSDLTSQATLAQLPTIGANTALGSIAGGTPIALTKTQLTTLINPATASLPGTLPAFPNNTTTYFRGDDTYVTHNCAALTDSSVYCSAARGQLPGETSTGSASAGNVGEYIESVIASGSATSLTTATAKTITSISLTAGDWEVSGNISFNSAGSVSITFVEASLSLTTNVVDQTVGRNSQLNQAANVPGSSPSHSLPVGPVRFSLSTTTSIFLVASTNFTVGTMAGFGIIHARRAR